jgi:hypothetical protein
MEGGAYDAAKMMMVTEKNVERAAREPEGRIAFDLLQQSIMELGELCEMHDKTSLMLEERLSSAGILNASKAAELAGNGRDEVRLRVEHAESRFVTDHARRLESLHDQVQNSLRRLNGTQSRLTELRERVEI